MSSVHFVDWIVKYDVKDSKQLNQIIRDLQTWGKFGTADKLKTWTTLFDRCIKEEFDEKCLTEPIPSLDGSEYYYMMQEHELDDGWVHEWELPEGFAPQDTYYDDGGL